MATADKTSPLVLLASALVLAALCAAWSSIPRRTRAEERELDRARNGMSGPSVEGTKRYEP